MAEYRRGAAAEHTRCLPPRNISLRIARHAGTWPGASRRCASWCRLVSWSSLSATEALSNNCRHANHEFGRAPRHRQHSRLGRRQREKKTVRNSAFERNRQSKHIFLLRPGSDEVGSWSGSNLQESIVDLGTGRKPIS